MKWPKHKAGELFDIQLGKMLNEKARAGDTFPYLANFNVRWGKFDLSELNQMAFSDREQEKFSLQLNDLLMCEGGEIGRCAVWMEKDSKIFYQKALHRLRPIGERVSSHFMHYYMHHLSTMGDLPKLVGETSIAHLTREKLVGLPVLSCTKYDGLVDSLEYFDKQVFSHDTSKYKVVGRGQFAYATNHIEEGSIGYQDMAPAGLVSPIYTVFQADAKRIDDGYFYKLLKTEKLRQIFSARTNSSVDRRGSLRWKDFVRIHIPLPPLDEQREINAVLDDAKQEIVLLQTKVKALKQQKRGLMQKLLTGQWRVPTNKGDSLHE